MDDQITNLIKTTSLQDYLRAWDYRDYTTIATLYQCITRDIKEIVHIMTSDYIFNCGYLEDTYYGIANRIYDTLTDDGEDEEEYRQYEEYHKWASSLDKLDSDLAEKFAKVKLMKDGWIISKEESWSLGLDPDIVCHFGIKEEVKSEYPISERFEMIIDYFEETSEIDKLFKIIVDRYDNHSIDFIKIIEHLESLIENHIVNSINIL